MSITFSSPPQRQLFSVPYNFILYIIENPASPKVLKKLYQTCKYFFIKNPILFPHFLACRPGGFYSAVYDRKMINSSARFWPLAVLVISSKIIPDKFYRFSPTYIYIENYTLLMQEFDMLVAEETVEYFNFTEGSTMNATVDFIFAKLPNVKRFIYRNSSETYSLGTLQKLNLIERKQKLEYCFFEISKISATFTPSLLASFFYKNSHPKIGHVRLELQFKLADAENLQLQVANAINNWKADNQRIFNAVINGSKIQVKFYKKN